MRVVLDIETIPLPAEQREFSRPTEDKVKYGNVKDPAKRQVIYDKAVEAWRNGDKAALDATTGAVALICWTGGDDLHILSGADMDEAELLDTFWLDMEEVRPSSIIGHNLINFDIKFLIRRSVILGVDVPQRYIEALFQKYKQTLYKDTMQFWGFGEYNYMISLKKLCAVFGIDVKEGEVDGKEFYRYWVGGDKEDVNACIKYCAQDVDATWQLAKKLRL